MRTRRWVTCTVCSPTSTSAELAHTAFEEKDYSTFNFLQWYVAEQHEEEKLFNTILDKIRIIGTEGRGLYHFDQEIAKLITEPGGSVMEPEA